MGKTTKVEKVEDKWRFENKDLIQENGFNLKFLFFLQKIYVHTRTHTHNLKYTFLLWEKKDHD